MYKRQSPNLTRLFRTAHIFLVIRDVIGTNIKRMATPTSVVGPMMTTRSIETKHIERGQDQTRCPSCIPSNSFCASTATRFVTYPVLRPALPPGDRMSAFRYAALTTAALMSIPDLRARWRCLCVPKALRTEARKMATTYASPCLQTFSPGLVSKMTRISFTRRGMASWQTTVRS